MTNFFVNIIIFFLFFTGQNIYSENSNNISEKLKTLNDSARANIRNNPQKTLEYTSKVFSLGNVELNAGELGKAYLYKAVVKSKFGEIDSAKISFNKALEYAVKAKDSLIISKIYNGLAKININTGNYKEAISWLNKTIKIKQDLADNRGLAIAYNQLGNAYVQLSQPEKAIQNYLKSVKIFESMNDLRGQAFNYNSMGALYTYLANGNDTLRFGQALEFYQKALKLNIQLKDSFEIATSYSNIGTVYANIYSYIVDLSNENILTQEILNKKNTAFDKAMQNYTKALKIREKLNDVRGLVNSEINLGHLLLDTNKTKLAEEYLSRAYKSSIKIQDVKNQIISLHHLAKAYKLQKKYDKAITTLLEGLKLAEEKQIIRLQRDLLSEAADIYATKGDLLKALEYKDKYINIKDKIIQAENNKVVEELNKKYQTEKKEQEIKLAKSELKKKELENRQQKLMLYGFTALIFLVLGVVVLIYRQYKQKQKANKILQEKNELITRQKNEITASIVYAQRIQMAILPPGDYIKEIIPERFILFKPRDIVSGDFYWLKHLEQHNTILMTAADCTGHGVPGAFLSMLGVTFLNEIVNQKNISTTGEVLNILRERVISSLHQTGKQGEQKDGMDIAFLAINTKTLEVQFSGANNPLYIVRENTKPELEADKKISSDTHTLYEIKGDKMPIGIYINDNQSFKTNYLKLEKGDKLYVFSDGYADQFGGPKGKKFKYKPFKKLLLSITDKTMQEQKQILDNTIEDWKNQPDTTYSQVDDIVILGIKL